MQLADAVGAIAIDAGLQDYFVYHEWMENGDVPEDVTHVRIDSSVRAIKEEAFCNRRELRIVILNKDLEEIGEVAHHGPEDLFIAIMTLIGALALMLWVHVPLALADFHAEQIDQRREEIDALATYYADLPTKR